MMAARDDRQVGSDEVLSVAAALTWIAGIFETTADRISEDARREDVPAWDSLGQLILMAALDQRFGIRMTAEELSSLARIGDILQLLARHGRLLGRGHTDGGADG